MSLRSHRNALGISQSRLARISGVSRFKICTYEVGDCSLTADERGRIREALQAETDRLHSIPAEVDMGEFSRARGLPARIRRERVQRSDHER